MNRFDVLFFRNLNARLLPPRLSAENATRRDIDGTQDTRANRLWDGFSHVVATPLLRKVEQRNAEILAKLHFEHFDLVTTAGRVHAVRSTHGSGVGAAIFVHGLSSSAAGNAPALAVLMGFFKDVAAIDLLCHGGSDHVEEVDLERLQRGAYEAMRIIAARQGGNVTLLGHSMGGYLVLDAGCDADAKQWIAGVIAGSPPGTSAATEHERSEAVRLFKMEERSHAFKVGRRACPEFSSALMPLVAAVAWRRFRHPSVQTVIRSDVSACSLADERLRNIQVPALLCWGEADGLVPLRHMDHLSNVMPQHTRVVSAPRIGHGNFVDGAPIFVEAIANFMKALDGVERQVPSRKRSLSMPRVVVPRANVKINVGNWRERLNGVSLPKARLAVQG